MTLPMKDASVRPALRHPASGATSASATAGGSASATASASALDNRFIYIAGPWTPMGGGMYKVADYLIQAQADRPQGPVLRALDTRGGGSAAASFLRLASAVGLLVRGRIDGRLAGVHVNMAERLSLLRKTVLVAVCRMLGIPVVLHLHAAQLHHTYRRLPSPVQALVRWAFSLPQSCVVLGKVAADFVTQELRVPAERVEIVVNGVPAPRIARRPSDGMGPTRILFVGNLSERKGVTDLLQSLTQPALAGMPLQLTLAGGGDVASYAALAERLNVADRVSFKGWTGQAELAQLLAQADVLVLPSYDEGLPLAILEALAQGVAVVCTPVGEIPEVLTNGRNAVFVEPGDPASIARGLARVLSEPDMRERLEQNGKALYLDQFSLGRFFDSVARIHQRQFGISAQPPRSAAEARP